MTIFLNLDLLFVGITVAGIGLLGFIILLNNPRSATNRAFFYFAGVSAVWSVANYVSYQVSALDVGIWVIRGVIFFAVWHAFTFFRLASVFPKEVGEKRFFHVYVLPVLTTIVSILTLTPYVFERVNFIGANGKIEGVQNGPAIAIFGLFVVTLIIVAIGKLIYRTLHTRKEERRPYALMLFGMVLTFVLILIFSLIIPATLNNSEFLPLNALFLIPFVLMTSYAIYRHHLFNLKVAATAFLGFMVTVFTFVNVLYSTQQSEVVINITAFVIVLLGSIKIVQNTLNLERITEELQEINERQEGLIHFIGHEVKGFLTKDEGVFASLSEGDFGELPPEAKSIIDHAFVESRQGADSVAAILKAANLKKGTVTYAKELFDMKALVAESVEKAKTVAEQKGITLSFSVDADSYEYTGDKSEIGEHVLRNLIDNAINYTPSGSIVVSLKKVEKRIVLRVEDTGVGISEEDKKRLFTEGGHGKDSIKVNVHSTGYGLFIAKSIVEAHGGTIRAESDGVGKGSAFIVELPA